MNFRLVILDEDSPNSEEDIKNDNEENREINFNETHSSPLHKKYEDRPSTSGISQRRGTLRFAFTT